MSQPALDELQHKAQRTQLTGVPRSGEVECADGKIIVDVAEEEYPATGSMDIDTPGMLIVGEEVDRAHADTDNMHLETVHCDELEASTLLGSPEQDELPVNELHVAQADGLPGIMSEETIRIMGKETIKVFVGGKKASVGRKAKDIDDYLKLFINAHCLPHNRRCRRIHSNLFFSNHGAYLFQRSSTVHSFIQLSSTHRKIAV